MGNDIGAYRMSIGLFYVRVYCGIIKKYCLLYRFGIDTLHFRLIHYFLSCLRWLGRVCFSPFTVNIYYTLILLLLLMLDNDIHQNPGPNELELSIFHLNARSIRNKIPYLEDIASENSIICVTESHLDENVNNSDILIEGFTEIYRHDRNCHGGGVLAYISQDIFTLRRSDLEFEGGEVIWIEVKIPNFKLLVCAIYRPPGAPSDYWDKLEYSIEQARNYTENIIITGDLNVNLLAERNHRLSELIDGNGLTNVIRDPTRMGALLDPVLITNTDIFIDSEVVNVDRDISDHDATLANFKLPYMINKSHTRKVWLYKNANYANLNIEIQNFDWDAFFLEHTDVDNMSKQFTNKYMEMVASHIPSKQIRVKQTDKPWFNSDIKREIRIRNRLHKNARARPSDSAIDKYKRQRNKVNNMKKHAREQFFMSANEYVDSLIKTNPKSYWSLIKRLMKGTGPQYSIPPLYDVVSNNHVYDDKAKANLLNSYFCSISLLNDGNHFPPNVPSKTEATLTSIIVSEQDVKDILKSLQVGKASGEDSISHQMLKNTADTISKPLAYLFNYCLQNCKYPSIWKLARVMPSFKKDDKAIPSNYRPIALLSCLGKVMERVVYKYIYNYVINNKLIYEYQSGFLRGHSTVYQLLEIYHNVCKKLDERMSTVIIFCDISKAFDKVWHKGLIKKLRSYGISGDVLKFIEDYVKNRTQIVFVNNQISDPGTVTAGVPQGSVLGPLLFLLYINDIADSLNNLARLFADDTSLSYSGKNSDILERQINADLSKLNDWAKTWLVDFNPRKTKALVISSSNPPQLNITFNNEIVEIVNSHKHLGVILSSDGNWTTHINSVAQKALKQINALRKLKFILSKRVLSNIYLSFIRPVLEYGCEVWDGCYISEIDKLEKIQLEAARIVTGLTKFASRESLYFETGWDTLDNRRKQKKLITFYKVHNKLCPEYLYDCLPPMVSDVNDYNLRDRENYILPRCRLRTHEKSFIPSTCALWNNLDRSIKNSPTVLSFKNNIKPDIYKTPEYYDEGSRKLNVLHTRLRHQCSSLNADLFRINIVDNPKCHCGFEYEDVIHYMLECPLYQTDRIVLTENLQNVDMNIETLLFGNLLYSFETNSKIFQNVRTFIRNTKRF